MGLAGGQPDARVAAASHAMTGQRRRRPRLRRASPSRCSAAAGPWGVVAAGAAVRRLWTPAASRWRPPWAPAGRRHRDPGARSCCSSPPRPWCGTIFRLRAVRASSVAAGQLRWIGASGERPDGGGGDCPRLVGTQPSTERVGIGPGVGRRSSASCVALSPSAWAAGRSGAKTTFALTCHPPATKSTIRIVPSRPVIEVCWLGVVHRGRGAGGIAVDFAATGCGGSSRPRSTWSPSSSRCWPGAPRTRTGCDSLDLPRRAGGRRSSLAVPLILGALAGVICERSGVDQRRDRGPDARRAFAGALVATVASNLGVGVIFGDRWPGGLMGLLLAVFAIRYLVNQVVLGVVLNLLALGLTGFLVRRADGANASGLQQPPDHARIGSRCWSTIPVIGPLLFDQPRHHLRWRTCSSSPSTSRCSGPAGACARAPSASIRRPPTPSASTCCGRATATS